MRDQHVSIARWCRHLPIRKLCPLIRLVLCFAAVTASVVFVETLSTIPGDVTLIWVANALLLSYFLLAPRCLWRFYALAGLLAMLAGGAVAQDPPLRSLLHSVLNIAEVVGAAMLLRPRSSLLPRFTDSKYLRRYLGIAVITAPLSAALAFVAITFHWVHPAPLSYFFRGVLSDSLGMALVTPTFVAIFRSGLWSNVNWSKDGWYLFLFLLVATITLARSQVPLIFLIYPLLLMIVLRMGHGWSAVAVLLLAVEASWFSVHRLGPFVAFSSAGWTIPAVHLQLFIAAAVFMIYAVSAVLDDLRATEHKLQNVVNLHNLVTENSRDVIILADFDGRRNYVSPAAANWGGWQQEELLGLSSLELVHPDDRPMALAMVRSLQAGGDGGLVECRVQKRDGDYVWVEANLRAIRDPFTSAPVGILNMVRDIGRRKAAEQEREFQSSLLRAILDVSLDGVLVVSEEGYIVTSNNRLYDVWHIPGFKSSTRRPVGHLPAKDEIVLPEVLNCVKDTKEYVQRVRELYADHAAKDQCQLELKDGRTLERYTTSLRNELGAYLGRAWFFRDISERKAAEEALRVANHELETLAVTDGLTGLANRRHFDQFISTEWRRGMRDSKPMSLLLIDVDLFKSYNDTYGHLCGDMCLKQIAVTAQSVISRPSDLVARFGGEEFAIILPNTPKEGALDVSQQLCEAIRRRALTHSANPLGILTISIGCATVLPRPAQHARVLIEKADAALYGAKSNGRNQVYDADALPESHSVSQAS